MSEPITLDDLKKVEIRVGEIISAEPIEGSDKLLKLKVNFADHERQVLSGIAHYFPDPQTLVGKRCPFITNLPARVMMGLESQAMLLAAGGLPDNKAGEAEVPFALFETEGTPGAYAR